MRCRNPIKANHRLVRHPLTDASFHDDCWAAVLADGQRDYERRIHEEGMDAILAPYLIALDRGPWLPDDSAALEPELEPEPEPESVGGQRQP